MIACEVSDLGIELMQSVPCRVLANKPRTYHGAVGVDDPPADGTTVLDIVGFVVADLEATDGAVGPGAQNCRTCSLADSRSAPQTRLTNSAVERGHLHFTAEAESVTQRPIVNARGTFDDHDTIGIGHQHVRQRRCELVESEDTPTAGTSGGIGEHDISGRGRRQGIGEQQRRG